MSIVAQDLGTVEFQEAYRLQHELVEAKIRGQKTDHFLLAEHPHVYTTGRGGNPENLPGNTCSKRIPVFRINRGGDATYHGPGQIVGYPLVELKKYGLDVNTYLRLLEQILIRTLMDFGISAGVRRGLTGVWTAKRKIACIGIGVRKGISMHGFALNVNTDLSFFEQIVSCGLHNAHMTSLQAELGQDVSMAEVKERLVLWLGILVGSKCVHRVVRYMNAPAARSKSII